MVVVLMVVVLMVVVVMVVDVRNDGGSGWRNGTKA